MTTLVIDLPDPYDFWGSTRSVGLVVAWTGFAFLFTFTISLASRRLCAVGLAGVAPRLVSRTCGFDP